MDGIATIPTGGAGSTAKVQQASGNAGVVDPSVTATLPATATPGNTLVAALAYRGTTTAQTDPTGWTKHSDVQGPAFDGGRLIFYSRTVPGGGLTGLTIGCSAQKKSLYIAEYSGLTAFLSDVETDGHSASTNMVTSSLTPGATPIALFAGFNQSARNPTIALQSPFEEDYDRDVDASGPSVVFGHRFVDPASGAYTASAISSQSDGYGAFLAAFSAAAGGITWVTAADTIDADGGTSDDVTATAIAVTGGAFWRYDAGSAVPIGQIIATLGIETSGIVSVLLQAGDEADYSDAATVVGVELDATGSYTADDFDITFDNQTFRYWQLVFDETAEGIRVYDVALAEAEEPTEQPAAKAILEIYVHDEDASRWGVATWATGPATGTEGIWSAAGWQDVTPEGVNAHIIWGSRRPSRGILADQNAASWNVETYDPDRILDPGNFDSPYYPQLVAGVPIRISHDSVVIRTGYVDEWHYKHKRPYYQGQILATDTWALLNQAMVPADSILGNTMYERIEDAITAAGIAVGGIPLPPSGTGPAIADWVEGAATDDPTSVGDHIRIATAETLWVPFIAADGGLGLRAWGSPLDRGREITSENLEDLESISSEDGLFSVVKVQVEDPDLDPIIRKAAPLPRYGERVWERREPTIDPEGYAAAILAERPWPGVQYNPAPIHCFTQAEVDYFGSLEIMERVSIVYPGVVSVQGRILGGELFVEHRAQSTQGAKWIFNFAVATDGATAIGLTTLVADGTGDTLLDDATETDYLEAD